MADAIERKILSFASQSRQLHGQAPTGPNCRNGRMPFLRLVVEHRSSGALISGYWSCRLRSQLSRSVLALSVSSRDTTAIAALSSRMSMLAPESSQA